MVAAATIEVSQTAVLAGVSEPSQTAEISQAAVLAAEDSNGGSAEITQVAVLAAVRGRVSDPSVKAWTFTLDGHDFYVLRLGNTETLVYDVTSEQWYKWADFGAELWGLYTGCNWVPGNKFAQEYGSNIICGSDSNGSLFFLDPDKETDDAAVAGREAQAFTRRVTAQIPLRGYNRASLYEVQLIGSTGQLNDTDLTAITLSYSDDRGANYVSAGSVTIEDGDYDTRATWRSLGSFSSPGRLIRIEDTGALKRIDSLTINSDLTPDGS